VRHAPEVGQQGQQRHDEHGQEIEGDEALEDVLAPQQREAADHDQHRDPHQGRHGDERGHGKTLCCRLR
jgi:hypothetical protein